MFLKWRLIFDGPCEHLWKSNQKNIFILLIFLLKSIPCWLTSTKLHHWGHTKTGIGFIPCSNMTWYICRRNSKGSKGKKSRMRKGTRQPMQLPSRTRYGFDIRALLQTWKLWALSQIIDKGQVAWEGTKFWGYFRAKRIWRCFSYRWAFFLEKSMLCLFFQ